MAQHKISGVDMAVFISRDNITFTPVICLTAIDVTRETTVIDAKSFCGPDSLPGTQSNTVSFQGQIVEDPTAGNISTDDLTDFWLTHQTIYFKVGKLVPVIGDETDYGSGFIAKLDKKVALDAVTTFDCTIGVYGLINRTTATS